MKQNIHKLAS